MDHFSIFVLILTILDCTRAGDDASVHVHVESSPGQLYPPTVLTAADFSYENYGRNPGLRLTPNGAPLTRFRGDELPDVVPPSLRPYARFRGDDLAEVPVLRSPLRNPLRLVESAEQLRYPVARPVRINPSAYDVDLPPAILPVRGQPLPLSRSELLRSPGVRPLRLNPVNYDYDLDPINSVELRTPAYRPPLRLNPVPLPEYDVPAYVPGYAPAAPIVPPYAPSVVPAYRPSVAHRPAVVPPYLPAADPVFVPAPVSSYLPPVLPSYLQSEIAYDTPAVPYVRPPTRYADSAYPSYSLPGLSPFGNSRADYDIPFPASRRSLNGPRHQHGSTIDTIPSWLSRKTQLSKYGLKKYLQPFSQLNLDELERVDPFDPYAVAVYPRSARLAAPETYLPTQLPTYGLRGDDF